MNKKLIKTIASLTLGLTATASIPAIVSSCGGDKKPDSKFYLAVGPGAKDPSESETKKIVMAQFVDLEQDKYSLKATLKSDLSTYTTMFFGYTDGTTTTPIEPLSKENVQFDSTGFATSWTTDAINRPVLKLTPATAIARTIYFVLNYKGLTETRAKLNITFAE